MPKLPASLRRPIGVAAALVLTGGLLAACSSDDVADGNVLNVYAAASLQETFDQIKEQFEQVHSDVDVRITYDGSSALVNQIQQGADVDVIATADEANMEKLDGETDEPQIFATNTLVIVTAPNNPLGIESFADLRRPDVTTVVCNVEVPCGSATAKVEENTGVELSPVSEETSVTAVLTKVTTGQADAGLVYVTDAASAGDQVATVDDPAFAEVINRYPIAVLNDAQNPEAAAMFRGMVAGVNGAEILGRAGFGSPGAGVGHEQPVG